MELIKEWKIKREERCREKDGWLSLIGLHWLAIGLLNLKTINEIKLINVGENIIGANSIKFNCADCPQNMGNIFLSEDGTLEFRPLSIEGRSTLPLLL